MRPQLSTRRRAALGARGAAFTTAEPAEDVVRLASGWDVRLVLVSPDGRSGALRALARRRRRRRPAREVDWTAGDGVFVPFGGTRARLGGSRARRGSRRCRRRADPAGRYARASSGRRDASRLLANASIAVQRRRRRRRRPGARRGDGARARRSGRAGEPRSCAGMRTPLARTARPLVLVHAGPRPGVLAPRESRTRFSWSLAG